MATGVGLLATGDGRSSLAALGTTLAKTLVCPTLLRKVVFAAGRRLRLDVAEGVGFEPTSPVRGCRFSRPVHSTALPPLRGCGMGAHATANPAAGPASL